MEVDGAIFRGEIDVGKVIQRRVSLKYDLSDSSYDSRTLAVYDGKLSLNAFVSCTCSLASVRYDKRHPDGE